MRRTSWIVCLAAALAIGGARVEAGERYVALGDEIVRHVQERFLDAGRARIWATRHRGYGAAAVDATQFERLTNRALAELGASHTAYYPRDSLENRQLRSLYASIIAGPAPSFESIGVDLVRIEGATFVRHVFGGGPAARAGLLRGDRIVSADGKPFDPVRSLAGRLGRPVALAIERVKGSRLLTVSVIPRETKPADEWIDAQDKGSVVVERAGRRIAYTQVYSCAGPRPLALLERTIQERFAGADALVIDLRDGWGGCPPELMNLFNPVAPTLRFVGRDGKARVWRTGWARPVVLVINGQTRSGKELVAYEFHKHDIGPLVGERTAGAFLAGTPIPLSDGSLLYLAVEDVQIDGVRLEGKGVPPDVAIASKLPYAAGADPQRDRAIALAAQLAAKRTRPP
ncbi:MAG TPA: S41 family peptidase [Kofleriaceae bacterium]|nr:S41 family peptidase [Kofleriaceae bacterium]